MTHTLTFINKAGNVIYVKINLDKVETSHLAQIISEILH